MNRAALEEIISSPLATEAQREDAAHAIFRLDNPDPVTSVDLVEPPADPGKLQGYDWFSALGSEHNEEKWVAGAKAWLDAIVTGPYTTEQKAEAQEQYAWQIEGIKTAAMVECDARFANIRAECKHLAKTLFPNEDPRLDQTSHLVDRAINNNWPAAWGKCPTGQWNGAPFAAIAPVVTSVPAPTQNEKSTNLQIQQLLSDDLRLGISSRPQPAAPPARLKSDIERLLENERAALDVRDAAASRRWNRSMGLSPAFQPGGFKGND